MENEEKQRLIDKFQQDIKLDDNEHINKINELFLSISIITFDYDKGK